MKKIYGLLIFLFLFAFSVILLTTPSIGKLLKYSGTNWINFLIAKTDVGLGNVDDTSDLNKPVSTATQTALNPKENFSNKGIANGYAPLGADGKVLSSQITATTTNSSSNRNSEVNSAVTGYATLAQAITTVGTRQVTLNVNTPQTCNSVIATDKNTTLEFTNAGKIIWSAGCSLTINSKILAERIQILSGFNNTNLIVSGGMDKIYPEFFGASGDYILLSGAINPRPTDNSPAFQLMLDVVRTPVSAILTTAESGTVRLDGKTYFFSTNIVVNNAVIMEGVSMRASVLQFAPNTSGIRINGRLTEDGGVKPYERNGDSSVLRNFTITSSVGADTHTVNIGAGLTLTRTTGSIFFADVNGLNTGISSGYTVSVNNWDWVIKSRVSDDVVTLFPYRLNFTRSGINTGYFAYPATTQAQANKLIGAKIIFPTDRVAKTIISATVSGRATTLVFNGADIPAGYSGDAEINELPLRAANSVRFNQWSGVDARINIVAENLYVTGFAGHGVRADTQAYPSSQFDAQPNTNNATFTRIFADSNHGAGFYARGLNSNNMRINQLNTGNNAMSVYDSSFLGNHYITTHSNSDRQGTWIGISPTGGNTTYGSQVDFGYIEAGQPSVLLGATSVWNGGDVGTGFATYYSGAPNYGFYSGNHLERGSPNYINRQSADKLYTWFLGSQRGENFPYIFAFGARGDSWASANLGLGSNQGLSYYLTAPQSFAAFNGGWRFQYGGFNGSSTNKTPFILTTSQQPTIGAGRIVFPNGAFFGTSEGDVAELNRNTSGLTVNKNFAAETLQISANSARPTCGLTTRGTLWVKKGITGAGGTMDVPQICIKNADDTYTWRNISIQ